MDAENQPQQPPTQQPQAPQQPTGGSSKVVWIIVADVTLLIIGGIVRYLMSRSKSETETTTPSESATEESESTEGEALPSKDVAGEDIEGIPRYPDSVRVEYSKDPDSGFINITCQTKDSIDEVKEYYLDEMVSRGWEMTSSEEDQLKFEKAPARLTIWFYYYEDDKITDYELRYFPE